MKVETITRKVETITKNVLILNTVCMKILICQPIAFAKGCFFVKEIEWGLGGNWIVATIMPEVATITMKVETITRKVEKITKNVLDQFTACMKILIWQPTAFERADFL